MTDSIRTLLENKNFSKLVCGAGNEDTDSVKKLVYIYAKAGWKIFDISARGEILSAAKEGLELAEVKDAHICVSIGIKGDPHISKAEVNNSVCIKCGNCAKNCPNGAIYPQNIYPKNIYPIIDDKKCIGCGICTKKCPVNAIKMYEKDIDVKKILPELINGGAEILELHVTGNDENDLEKKWQIINECRPLFASICIDRENFGNKDMVSRISKLLETRNDYTTIIQADGIPMSGSKDDYKTTLQAAATAEIIQNANLPAYLVVSGGTNSKTAELCKLCNIYPNGIAIGSWARKIVRPIISKTDFWENTESQMEAVKIAKELLSKNFD